MEAGPLSDNGACGSNTWSATRALAAFDTGALSPGELLEACQARIRVREPEVRAFEYLDWDIVQAQIESLAGLPQEKRGPLWGLPIAVKDIFDTQDMPTTYGSRIYSGHRPAWDAACVARLRAAGGIVLGKTTTTEFAYWQAAKTRNPHDLTHTPGGSSSGSVAAVADQMAPLALGSQTAASTIRPAAYCGIVGFKPTRGLISLAGIKALAGGLDTVGLFGRCVGDVGLLASVMAKRPALCKPINMTRVPSARLWTGLEWKAASDSGQASVTRALELLRGMGAKNSSSALPGAFMELCAAQTTIMAFEAARELAHERRVASDRLSRTLLDLLHHGEDTSAAAYDAAIAKRQTCLENLDQVFDGKDVLMLPSAPDVAPVLSEGTGDPIMSRAWTLLGLPSITIPCGRGDRGLPLGLQLATRPGEDEKLLAIASLCETHFSESF